jgi:D-sedoheptulose 7-phosphate isomerase
MQGMDYKQDIKAYIEMERSVLAQLDINAINAVMNELDEARERGAAIYIMGNGGSASTASHFVNDFNKGVSEHLEQPFRFVCLNDNVATIMAIANDIGYDAVFEFQLRGKVAKGDLVIGISGSGNSPNVLKAVERAKSVGAKTIGLTGFDGGKLKQLVDLPLHVAVMSMQVTEDLHMVFDHLMMAVFYKTLCGINHIKVKYNDNRKDTNKGQLLRRGQRSARILREAWRRGAVGGAEQVSVPVSTPVLLPRQADLQIFEERTRK